LATSNLPSAQPSPLNLPSAKPPISSTISQKLLQDQATAALAGNAVKGEKIYTQKCKVCHQIGEGARNFVGPELNGLIGRKAGSLPDYNYTDATKESYIVWDMATLKEYLADPKAKIPGTKMIFVGLPKESDRDNLVAYLAQFD
jgi:cytochrome c